MGVRLRLEALWQIDGQAGFNGALHDPRHNGIAEGPFRARAAQFAVGTGEPELLVWVCTRSAWALECVQVGQICPQRRALEDAGFINCHRMSPGIDRA